MVDRHAAVRDCAIWLGIVARIHAVRQREDLGARRHDVAHELLAELDDAADDRDLFALADALELSFAQQILDRVAVSRNGGRALLADEHVRDRFAGADDRQRHDIDDA